MSDKKTIKDQILCLIEMQAIDTKIYNLKKEKNKIPEDLSLLESKLEGKKTGIKKAEDNLKTLQVKLKEKEGNLQQKEGEIKKLESQLSQLKTNKEYSTMLKEIEGLKVDNSITEEDILKIMDSIDESKKNILEEKELFKKEEVIFKEKKDEILKRDKEIDLALNEFSTKRGTYLPNLEPIVLKHYERILNNKDGLAIVPVENGTCGGCFMNLPPQVISEAKLKENIIICGNCTRILYVGDDVEID